MSGFDSAKPKILIVDDVSENLHAMMNLLRDEFAIIAATNGEKALQLAAETPLPELILLDIKMPEMDGYEVLRRLKGDPATAEIPVIFVTGLSDEVNEAQGLDLGAVDYIAKPPNPAITLLRVRHQIALKRAQQELRESEEMLRAITDAVQTSVFLIDDEDTVRFANPAVQEMFGYTQRELVGKKLHSLFVPERNREKAAMGMESFKRTGEGPVLRKMQEMEALHKDGNELVTLIHVGRIKKNGKWWAAGSAVDITELRKAQSDLLKSQQEAMQAGRLASIGYLASGIAHEINTPAQYITNNLAFLDQSVDTIGSIVGAAQKLAEATTDTEAVQTFNEVCTADEIEFLLEELPNAIGQSKEGIAHIAKIVLSMKEFSHPGDNEKHLGDIHKALDSVITITQNASKNVAVVTKCFNPDLPQIRCNINELRQVFLNLIINSIQAIEASQHRGDNLGEIVISTELHDNSVSIAFSDTGDGVADEIRDRVFDPFFTTKEVGQGSGQGLNICYDIIVNKHGGKIEVKNKPNSGAVFTVRLPVKATIGDGD
ncbi:MAG: response regulator [Candidatus Thiodiazotropha sp.]